MPSAMIHIQVGKYFDPGPGAAFLVGTLAPDCVKEREQKDILHFRVSNDRNADLVKLLRRYGTENDFLLGAVLHLYTDYLWDEGPQTAHKNAYTGETWFKDYRMEINLASCYMYHHDAALREDFEKIMSCPASEYSHAAEYTPEAIDAFLEHSYQYITTHDIGPSPAFPPDFVDRFCRETAESFKNWLEKNKRGN